VKNELHRTAFERVCLWIMRVIMFPHTCHDFLLRNAGIVAAVGASENVDRCFQDMLSPRPSRLMAPPFAPQDEGKARAAQSPQIWVATGISNCCSSAETGPELAHPHPEVTGLCAGRPVLEGRGCERKTA
jgi:hypothetical protein